MSDDQQPIVIKKVVKGGGHHGGSWKVAFADFATAMMAFFLLLWLLGFADDVTKGAIAEYFEHPAGVQGPGGASSSMIDFGGGEATPRPQQPKDRSTIVGGRQRYGMQGDKAEKSEDEKRLEILRQNLEEAIGRSQALEPFKDQLFLSIDDSGLRIQIVDKSNRAMFDIGSAQLKPYARDILFEFAEIIERVPNLISIAGHTDARTYVRDDYSNWELSADRANAARRALLEGGMGPERISRVVGMGASVLFNPTDPLSPVNRRISILVMNEEKAEEFKLEAGAPQDDLLRVLEDLQEPIGGEQASGDSEPAPTESGAEQQDTDPDS